MFPVVVKWKWRSCIFTMLAISLLVFWSTQMLVDTQLSYLMSTWLLTWKCIHITVMRKTGTNNKKEHLLINCYNLLEERDFLFACTSLVMTFISEFVPFNYVVMGITEKCFILVSCILCGTIHNYEIVSVLIFQVWNH